MIQKIEPAAAIRLLDAKKAQAVDVREPDEYAVGHIPGAKLLPLGEVMSRAAEVLPDKDAPWLVYCRTGRRSADAVQKLDALGYTNIYDLGGILSWPYEIEGDCSARARGREGCFESPLPTSGLHSPRNELRAARP